jgi:hypothetical protein
MFTKIYVTLETLALESSESNQSNRQDKDAA